MVKYDTYYKGDELINRADIQEKYSTYDLKEWLNALYGLNQDDHVLDLGCGNGKDLLSLTSSIAYGLGIDSSKHLIEKANEKTVEKNIGNLDFHCINCDEYNDLKKKSFLM